MNPIANAINSAFVNWLNTVATDLLRTAVKIIQDMLINPLFMNKLNGFSILHSWITFFAFSLLGAVMLKEILMNILEEYGDTAAHPLVIVKNTILSGALIVLSPILITTIIMPIIQEITKVLTATLGSPYVMAVNVPKQLDISTPNTALATQLSPIAAVIYVLVIAICMLIIGLSAGIRWGELFLLALAGPILAITKTSYSTTWDIWLRETIAVSLSQVVQYFGLILSLDFLVHPEKMSAVNGAAVPPIYQLFIAAGLLIFAVKGPSVLRSFITPGNANGLRALQGLSSAVRAR